MKLFRIFILSWMVFIVGCATTANFEKKLQSWVGNSESSLLSSWGPPDQTYPNGDGKIITYSRSSGSRSVANYNQFTNQVNVDSYTYYCKTSFYLDGHGTITSWRWEGNACRSN